jgi:SP family galactose:H+ symporter-like MFS transporter
LVSQFFLSLVTAIGSSLTFGLLALLCVVGWLWIYRVVPETKGLTLEKVQELWSSKS